MEAHRVGGDCTWTGCVPSKALIKVAKVAHLTRQAAAYGIVGVPEASAVRADMAAVKKHVAEIIQRVYRHESPEVLQARNIDVILGRASFLSPSEIEVQLTGASGMGLGLGRRPQRTSNRWLRWILVGQ